MDLVDKIQEIAGRIPKQIEHINTEEATKNAFIMPFISALGYDIFNPTEVIPEFTADIGTKKGEKVDYAIKKDDKIIILIECKWCGSDLKEEETNQLYRYFSATEARFGILTNGITYKFFSDIVEQNKMDSRPFFEFSVPDFESHQIEELKKFTKSSFDLDNILDTASTLKYTSEIKQIFAREIADPSDDFVKFFASEVYSGTKKTQSVIAQFKKMVKTALNQFIREKINDRLKSALEAGVEEEPEEKTDIETPEKDDDGIVTTQEEIDGYNTVKAILGETVDLNRVFMRDTKSYCGILLDDNNRKPICRLRFNSPTAKRLGVFKQKKETKHPVENVNDIYNYSEEIKATVSEYLESEKSEQET